jgi:acyl-CoA reductase-like NAD-dependent aldehyde dehydrogenase
VAEPVAEEFLDRFLARAAALRQGDPRDEATDVGPNITREHLGRLSNHVVAGPVGIPAEFGAQPTASEEVVSTALGGDWEFRGVRPPARS